MNFTKGGNAHKKQNANRE